MNDARVTNNLIFLQILLLGNLELEWQLSLSPLTNKEIK